VQLIAIVDLLDLHPKTIYNVTINRTAEIYRARYGTTSVMLKLSSLIGSEWCLGYIA